MKILGISAYYHDSAAALLGDGAILAAAQEERFSRKKHDSRFPEQAIRYCLSEASVSLEDVDRVYSTESLAEALTILRKYSVTYVFVGSLELGKYPQAGLRKFEAGLPTAFRSGQSTVYRVPVESGPAELAQ